jgi:nucleoside-diphosphate-sugar epimerase
MKIFLAGATGALGKRLVPLLARSGHQVTGTTRSAAKADAVRALGAEPVVVDGLDRDALVAAVRAAEPEVVVHQMTALAGGFDMRNLEATFELTNRLRSEGTDNLLAGAREAGARRFVAQSFTSWPYARVGGPVKGEDEPLDPDPPAALRTAHAAIRHVEEAVTGARGLEGLVLRYGGFYGPGTSLEPGSEQVEAVTQRKFPLIGSGGGVWSFIHIDDAAAATLAAIERGAPGIYNIVDDEPAPVSEWLPALAETVGAKPPRRLPAWVARLLVGDGAVTMMTSTRGASNAKAKRELGWRPAHPTWRQGFRAEMAGPAAA